MEELSSSPFFILWRVNKIPFTNNPATNPVDRVRLTVGDAYTDLEILSDDTYDYLLDKYSNNERRAALDAATYILMYLSRYTRERTGDIEVYGSEWATNYRKALLEFIRNPSLSPINPIAYAGGISKTDMIANDNNPDNVRPCLPHPTKDTEYVLIDDTYFEV